MHERAEISISQRLADVQSRILATQQNLECLFDEEANLKDAFKRETQNQWHDILNVDSVELVRHSTESVVAQFLPK